MDKNKLLLVILDGWGLSPNTRGNAPFLARTPVLDNIYKNYPKTLLQASGTEVGLLAGEPGNSEVGHSNIGSGKVVWQNLPKIDRSIDSKELANNYNLGQLFAHCRTNNRPLHLVGLVSDGGIHSHIAHLVAIIEAAAASDVADIIVHFISDGRDTPPKKANTFARQLEAIFAKVGRGSIATLTGRYYAMDRDKNMDRTLAAFDLYTQNKGKQYQNFNEALEANYKNGKTDEFVEPSIIGRGGKIQKGDSILFFNFRSDRMKQIFALFTKKVNTISWPDGYAMATMAQYVSDTHIPILFPPAPHEQKGSLAEIIAKNNLTQFHTAETEKYAHVTYFLNSGLNKAFPGERDYLVPSRKIPYNRIPEMSAEPITAGLLQALDNNYGFIVVNYANGDMVGHTGILQSVIKGCEVVDACLGKVFAKASANGYKVILISDHGNCDEMVNDIENTPNKEHTLNPVPFVLADFTRQPFGSSNSALSKDEYVDYAAGDPVAILADIAPTILAQIGAEKPDVMVGMDITQSLDKQ